MSDIRVCDFVSDFIYKSGVKDVFMVSGGGVMFLTDGLACNKNLRKICCHHEQAAAFAAVGYAKYKGLGCAYFTTGCGGSNAVTGVLNAWQDNIPCIFIFWSFFISYKKSIEPKGRIFCSITDRTFNWFKNTTCINT